MSHEAAPINQSSNPLRVLMIGYGTEAFLSPLAGCLKHLWPTSKISVVGLVVGGERGLFRLRKKLMALSPPPPDPTQRTIMMALPFVFMFVFGGFADIVPTGCTLLAEAAVAVDALEADELDNRIKAANEAAEAAVVDADKTRLAAFAAQLEDLKAVI